MKAIPALLVFVTFLFSPSTQAQTRSTTRPHRMRTPAQALNAEQFVKQAAEELVAAKKIYDRDLEVLRHLQAADVALADTMQVNIAIQKAFEEVSEAKRLAPEFLVRQGVIRIHQELEAARRSPVTADLSKLHMTLKDEAIGPASRLVVRNALAMEEETLGWIKVQELISQHLRSLSEIAGESLRTSDK